MGSGTGSGGKGGLFTQMANQLGQQINAQTPQQPNNFTYNPSPPNQYTTDYEKYTTSQLPNQNTNGSLSGEAFNNGVNSDSGIASILAGLYSSGVFSQQNINPYAPKGTVGSFTGIPYGQQQESMFSRQGLNNNPYGGSQGQQWNPYGNYYTSSNTSAGGGNTNNNIAPPPGSTGPDALQQLSFMMNRNNTQI
jgi:hypothetical protein